MQRNSATYMFVFAAIVCVVCAVFVSGAAVALNERQDANASLDKQKNVLYAAGLTTVEEGLDREAITSLFDERVEAVAVDMSSHQETDQIDPLQYVERCSIDNVLRPYSAKRDSASSFCEADAM